MDAPSKQSGHELERHIFEGKGGAMPEFENRRAIAKELHRGRQRGIEIPGVGRLTGRSDLGLRIVGQKGLEDRDGPIGVG